MYGVFFPSSLLLRCLLCLVTLANHTQFHENQAQCLLENSELIGMWERIFDLDISTKSFEVASSSKAPNRKTWKTENQTQDVDTHLNG